LDTRAAVVDQERLQEQELKAAELVVQTHLVLALMELLIQAAELVGHLLTI
jgi:hypothetical protein